MIEANRLVEEFISSGNYETPENINNGGCLYFANQLVELAGKGIVIHGKDFYTLWTDLYDQPAGYGGHWVALIDGKLYDAENPDGVNHPDELNIYIRSHNYNPNSNNLK